MEVKNESNDDSPRQGAIGPGERLQAARIKKGLSVEDVANRMHLSTSILEAIEENNFDEITAPIFVKGYLRAYARIVALSEDEMIQQYIDFYSEEDPPISSTSNMAPELSVADARIKWTTYLVIVVLGVLLAAWWWNKQQNEASPISLDSQSSQAEEVAVNEQSSIGSEIQAGSESLDDGDEMSQPVEADVAAQSEETAEAGVDDEMIESAEAGGADETLVAAASEEAVSDDAPASGESASEESTLQSEAAAQTAESTESSTVEVTELAMETDSSNATNDAAGPVSGTRELPARVAPVGSDRLEIVVHADTWADVKDANNHQLLYDLLRADNVVQLSGQAPFSVFLGNGHGVEIMFNDAEVGITSKIRNDNTARLDVGG